MSMGPAFGPCVIILVGYFGFCFACRPEDVPAWLMLEKLEQKQVVWMRRIFGTFVPWIRREPLVIWIEAKKSYPGFVFYYVAKRLLGCFVAQGELLVAACVGWEEELVSSVSEKLLQTGSVTSVESVVVICAGALKKTGGMVIAGVSTRSG